MHNPNPPRSPLMCRAPLKNRPWRLQLTSNDVWAVCQTYGVEAARASIVAEIINVFGAYGIAVDPRHLGLVADHMTFDGGYRPLNRAGMADFSSPCLQVCNRKSLKIFAPPAYRCFVQQAEAVVC